MASELQKRRTMSYFILATQEIINEEGIAGISIRKIAARAGFNSATLYNYFSDLDELVCYASIRYLKDYNLSVDRHLKDCKNAKERLFTLWELFCRHSFANPQAFYRLFFSDLSDTLEEAIQKYYRIFPEEFGKHEALIGDMLLTAKLEERNALVLNKMAQDGFLASEGLAEINLLIISYYQSLLFLALRKNAPAEYQRNMMRMLEFILSRYA